MSEKKYHFITPTSTSLYAEQEILQPITFAQISGFASPSTKKHEFRIVHIAGDNTIASSEYKYLDESEYKRAINTVKPNKYKIYSVFSLKDIALPSYGDILLARSNILANDYDYSGVSTF